MRHALVVLGLFAVTAAIYLQTATFDFVYYDDNVYLLENERFEGAIDASDVAWAFTTDHHSNWHPLTWLSYFLDYTLFGLDPGAFHLTSVVLHAVNAALVYALFLSLTGAAWPSVAMARTGGKTDWIATHPLAVKPSLIQSRGGHRTNTVHDTADALRVKFAC